MHNKKGSEKFGVETIASGHLISLGKKTKEPGVQFETPKSIIENNKNSCWC